MKLVSTFTLLNFLVLTFLSSQAQENDNLYIDVITYNTEWLGKPEKAGLDQTRSTQIKAVAEDILRSSAEVVALQEVVIDEVNGNALEDLLTELNQLDTLEEWAGGYNDYFSFWWSPDFENYPAQRQAFVYKTSVFKEVKFSTLLLEQVPQGDNRFASGRLPFSMEALLIQGDSSFSVQLINLHLKCCQGNQDRRKNSMQLLLNNLQMLPDRRVVLLGDFNTADQGGAYGEAVSWGTYRDVNQNQKWDFIHLAGSKKDRAWSDIDHIFMSEQGIPWYQAVPDTMRNRTIAATYSDHDIIKTTLRVNANTIDDQELPSIPQDLKAKQLNESTILLNWTPSTDNIGVYGYTIYQEEKLIGFSRSNEWRVADLKVMQSHHFAVQAVDSSFNISPFSETLSFTLEKENQLPVVSIISPEQDFEVKMGNMLRIEVEAYDQDGDIQEVAYYVNDSLIGIDQEAPFAMEWKVAEVRTYSLMVTATDNDGGKKSSSVITVQGIENEDLVLQSVFTVNDYAYYFYPNPLKAGGLHLSVEQYSTGDQWKVLSLGGQVIREGNIDSSKTAIQLTLPNGIYFLQLRLNGTLYTNKLIVERD
ncbi:Ig-like domain-containing protein [Algivirga pacifica]|uniref:Fibronectin type-III domain-containing protein n=1 Tax=Algivirga pacifica TaxID=1162670 RepID=A0ABP9CVY1_9BACT